MGCSPFFNPAIAASSMESVSYTHLRYKYLADADKKNTFDIERYMKRRPAIVKPDEPFDLSLIHI